MFTKLSPASCIRKVQRVRIGVLGVPFDKGQPKPGVKKGPRVIRQAELIKQLQGIHEGIDVEDYGDVQYTINCAISGAVPNMKNYEHVIPCAEETSKQVTKIICRGRICLSLGGDHSIGIGTVHGHIQAKSGNVALLWVDAHGDINTNNTTYTCNIHGMPVALLAKELAGYWPYLPGMDWKKSTISVRNIAYIGLRSVDSYERLIIDKLGITAFGMEDVEKYGINTVVTMALDRIDPEHNKSIHVSFDIDSLNTSEAPSTGISVRGGLTLREAIYIMEAVHRTGKLGAMDLVEINPSIGTSEDVSITVQAAIHVILAAFGYSRKGLRPTDITDLPLPK